MKNLLNKIKSLFKKQPRKIEIHSNTDAVYFTWLGLDVNYRRCLLDFIDSAIDRKKKNYVAEIRTIQQVNEYFFKLHFEISYKKTIFVNIIAIKHLTDDEMLDELNKDKQLLNNGFEKLK